MTTSEIENLKIRLDQIKMLDHASAHALLRDSAIYARRTFGDQSPHITAIENVQFRHPSVIFNSGHHMNSDIWNQGVRDLRSAFDAMSYEKKLAQAPTSANPPIDKITLDWIIKHVPLKFWAGAIAMLLTSFTFGYAAGSNRLINQLVLAFKSSQ